MPKNKSKKVVQKLKNEKLRKVRYELRTLLRLEKEKRLHELHERFVTISEDESLSYDECKEKHRFIIRKDEKLDRTSVLYPLCCCLCGDRMENLVYSPGRYEWRCVPCYDYAHEAFPEEYP